MRRTIRVGASDGTVLEELDVVPDRIHRMTRDDLFDGLQGTGDSTLRRLTVGVETRGECEHLSICI
jgi:hypothetical protein